MLVSEERGKPGYPEKNLSEQGREPRTVFILPLTEAFQIERHGVRLFKQGG